MKIPDLSRAMVGPLGRSAVEAWGVGGSLCTTVAAMGGPTPGDEGSVAVEVGRAAVAGVVASSASHGCSIIHVASELMPWAVASPEVPVVYTACVINTRLMITIIVYRGLKMDVDVY